jgi:hypothetical protein
MNASNQTLWNALLEVWAFYPQMRFGQLVCAVASWAGESEPGNVYDVSDDDLIRAAREHVRKKRAEQSQGPAARSA